jgi:hypothetical protein
MRERRSQQAAWASPEDVGMPRDRQRATLESGPKLDLAKLIRCGAGKPDTNIRCTLTYASGETVIADIKRRNHGGWLELSHGGGQQTFSLASSPRHFGGLNGTSSAPGQGAGSGCSTDHCEPRFSRAVTLGAAALPMPRSSLIPLGVRGASRQRSKHASSAMKIRTNGICRLGQRE